MAGVHLPDFPAARRVPFVAGMGVFDQVGADPGRAVLVPGRQACWRMGWQSQQRLFGLQPVLPGAALWTSVLEVKAEGQRGYLLMGGRGVGVRTGNKDGVWLVHRFIFTKQSVSQSFRDRIIQDRDGFL